ncbi:hypothetical protein HDU96_009991 [Phlyctochytrium bullatum]|nr:hypothetical protein HDU96_009991 [Phlyctochytrium bullatum]
MIPQYLLLAAIALISPASVLAQSPAAVINVGRGGISNVDPKEVTVQVGSSVQWRMSGTSYYLYQQPGPNNCTISPNALFGGDSLIGPAGDGYTYTFSRVGDYYFFMARLAGSECQNGAEGVIKVIQRLPSTTAAPNQATGTAAANSGSNAGSSTSGGGTITNGATIVTGGANAPTGPSVPYVTFGGASGAGFGVVEMVVAGLAALTGMVAAGWL